MREIKSAENLVADVEGDIEEVDGVLKITMPKTAAAVPKVIKIR